MQDFKREFKFLISTSSVQTSSPLKSTMKLKKTNRKSEIAGKSGSGSQSQSDNVKMKFSKGKNTSDLEMVVESLKRVVEKLKNSKFAG